MGKYGLCMIWKTNTIGLGVLYKDNDVRICHAKKASCVFCVYPLFFN